MAAYSFLIFGVLYYFKFLLNFIFLEYDWLSSLFFCSFFYLSISLLSVKLNCKSFELLKSIEFYISIDETDYLTEFWAYSIYIFRANKHFLLPLFYNLLMLADKFSPFKLFIGIYNKFFEDLFDI